MTRSSRGPAAPPPAAPEAPSARVVAVRAIAERLATMRGPLMPILHGIVHDLGYVDEADIPVVADVLNLSRADVHGVVTFYKDFRRTPAPAHRVVLCRAEACQSVGSDALYSYAEQSLGGRDDVEVDHVFCWGNCALGPAGEIDGKLHGRLSPERLDALTSGWSS